MLMRTNRANRFHHLARKTWKRWKCALLERDFFIFFYIINGAKLPHRTPLDEKLSGEFWGFFFSRRLNILFKESIEVVGHLIL